MFCMFFWRQRYQGRRLRHNYNIVNWFMVFRILILLPYINKAIKNKLLVNVQALCNQFGSHEYFLRFQLLMSTKVAILYICLNFMTYLVTSNSNFEPYPTLLWILINRLVVIIYELSVNHFFFNLPWKQLCICFLIFNSFLFIAVFSNAPDSHILFNPASRSKLSLSWGKVFDACLSFLSSTLCSAIDLVWCLMYSVNSFFFFGRGWDSIWKFNLFFLFV